MSNDQVYLVTQDWIRISFYEKMYFSYDITYHVKIINGFSDNGNTLNHPNHPSSL